MSEHDHCGNARPLGSEHRLEVGPIECLDTVPEALSLELPRSFTRNRPLCLVWPWRPAQGLHMLDCLD